MKETLKEIFKITGDSASKRDRTQMTKIIGEMEDYLDNN